VKEYTDQEIIECLKNRESYVVRWLSDRYMPMIRLMVHQMGGTLDDAKDIFQDGLLVMLEKIDDKDFALTCKFKTYLYCVCENLWNLVLKRRKAANTYLQVSIEDNQHVDFTENQDDALYEKIFYDVFNNLQPRWQKILKLSWQDVSPQEMAKDLGVSYNYIRKKRCEIQNEFIKRVKQHPDYVDLMESEETIKNIVH
jgi:RNA polymerase sigma factor (sigma-70 family)